MSRQYIVLPCLFNLYAEYIMWNTGLNKAHSGIKIARRNINNLRYADDWRRQWHPNPVLLPGKSHGWRSLVGCSPWVARSRTRLSDSTFAFHFHALEKEMAAHSSVLAWRIPGMGAWWAAVYGVAQSRTRLK